MGPPGGFQAFLLCSYVYKVELLGDWLVLFLFLFFYFLKKFYLFIYLFIYLFMAVLGLRFCARAFSSCGKQGPLFITVRGLLTVACLSCCGAQAPDAQAQ